MHRAKDERVTQLEITKALRILGIPEVEFWKMADGCMIDSDTAPTQTVNPDNPLNPNKG
jgi:LmbE family N-acetylglucosaminyl deacetylase